MIIINLLIKKEKNEIVFFQDLVRHFIVSVTSGKQSSSDSFQITSPALLSCYSLASTA